MEESLTGTKEFTSKFMNFICKSPKGAIKMNVKTTMVRLLGNIK